MKSCTGPKLRVFLLTFFAYSTMHSIRTSWSYSKSLLQNHQASLYISNQYLGLCDAVFLVCYALGLAFLGPLGDHINQRYYLSCGYALAAVSFLVYPSCYHFLGWTNVWILVVTLGTNGLGESVGMPGSIKVLSNWFDGEHKGGIVGFWAGCRNYGNVFGLVASTVITQYLHLRWEYSFFFVGLLALVFALLVFLFLEQKPEGEDEHELEQGVLDPQETTKRYNFFTSLSIPRVLPFTISYACLKASIYGLLFWLPKYVHERGMTGHSGYIPSMVDFGTFVGGFALGYLGDRCKKQSILLPPLIFLSCLMMVIASYFLGASPTPYYFVVFLMGLGLGGPYNIIGTNRSNEGTVMAMDLGSQKCLSGDKKAISTVTAVVDGWGALFSALTQVLLALVPSAWIFRIFAIYTLCAGIVLVPLSIRDYREAFGRP